MIKIEVLGKKFEIDSKFVGEVRGFPNSPDDKNLHYHFKIGIKHGGKKISFDFYGSTRDWQEGIDDMNAIPESLVNAFRIFLEDAISGLMGFEEFANEYGYDPDSRRAEKVWKAVRQQTTKAHALGLSDDELYDLSNAMREDEENYTKLSGF